MTNPKIDRAVEALRPQIIDTLRRWLTIPSVKAAKEPGAPFGKPLETMLNTALSDAEKLGLSVRNFDGYIGDADMGDGDEVMGILAHLDVVPAGDGWTDDPFAATERDGKMYARGAMDDKGPAVAALFAMKAVLDAGLVLNKKVRLILGCDEESGWDDIRYYQQKTSMPDFGFSPDAVFPIINTEKGILHLTIRANYDAKKSASLPVYSIHSGERPNVIPGLATAEVGCDDIAALAKRLEQTGLSVTAEKAGEGRAKLVSTGVTGHASMPHLGKNAAGQLLLALHAIEAGGGLSDIIAKLAKAIGLSHDGAGLGIDGSDTISGPLTLNLGVLHAEDGQFMAKLDIRHPVLMNADMIAKIIGMQLADVNITAQIDEAKAPLHVPKESNIVQQLLSVYHEVTGLEPYAIAIGGGTYSRSMDNCVAFGSAFPGEPDLAHQAGEYIDLENLIQNVRIFAHAIERLAC